MRRLSGTSRGRTEHPGDYPRQSRRADLWAGGSLSRLPGVLYLERGIFQLHAKGGFNELALFNQLSVLEDERHKRHERVLNCPEILEVEAVLWRCPLGGRLAVVLEIDDMVCLVADLVPRSRAVGQDQINNVKLVS